MSQFSMSGPEAVARGYSAISGIGKQFQDDKAYPRELEAALKIKEAQATVASTQALEMQRIAGLEKESADAMAQAGRAGDIVATKEDLMKRALQHGMVGYASSLQKELQQSKLDSYKTLEEAAKVKQTQNEQEGSYLRGLTGFPEAEFHINSKLQEAEDKFKASGSQEDQQEVMRWRGAKGQFDQYKDGDFSKYKKNVIEPYADSLDKRSDQLKALHAQNQAYYQDQLIKKADADRAERAREANQRTAVARERIKATAQAKADAKTADTPEKIGEFIRKNAATIGSLTQTKKDLEEQIKDPDSGWFNTDKIDNPEWVNVNDQIKELQAINLDLIAKRKAMSKKTPAPKVESVTVGDKSYTRPAGWDDAKWEAYKKSVGAK